MSPVPKPLPLPAARANAQIVHAFRKAAPASATVRRRTDVSNGTGQTGTSTVASSVWRHSHQGV
jgi:hypothetical protein